MTLQIGEVLYNRYRIDDVIAQGGMGAIYRAYDQSLGVYTALKENLFETDEATRQFRREATLLAGLRHPNLPRVTDHFIISGQGQYLVMDFIEGQDLRQHMQEGSSLREDEVIAIGAVVCEALQYLHTRKPPVVHRDIKPGNIKVTPNGQVFLVDFGLAKVATPGQATTTGAQALTPGYAPPEQYGQGTTPLSDIYALGATLYALLTGKIPEDGLARAMGSTQLTPLLKYNPHISERTALVVEHAMAIRAEDRFQSAEEFRLALLNSPGALRVGAVGTKTDGSPLSVGELDTARKNSGPLPPATQRFPTVITPIAPPATTPPPGGPPPSETLPLPPASRRFPLAWIVGAALALVVIVVGVLFALNNPAAKPPGVTPTDVPVPTEAATFTPLPATPTQAPSPTALAPTATLTQAASPTRGPTATPAPSLTPTRAATPLGGGGVIAYASMRDGSRPQIWLVNADGSNQRQLTNLVDGACQPAWAPDGKRLVFVSPCSQHQEEYVGSTLFLVNADGSTPEPLPSLPGGDFDPAWSPDGSQILFTSLREGAGHIFVMNMADRKVERVTGPFSDDRRGAWAADGKRIAFESTRLGTRQIWVMGPKGENQAEFTRLSEGPAFNAVWSADGSILYYNREAALPVVFARRTDTATLATESRLTDLRPLLRPRISSDGQWMTFESWSGGNHDIFIMRVSGTGRQAVTNDPHFDFDPAWKP